MELLISKGAKINALDRQYGTPLHAACHGLKSDPKCILLLLQAGKMLWKEYKNSYHN